MKVRIVQTFSINATSDGIEILDSTGLCMTRKPTLEEAFDSMVEMVSKDALTDDIEAELVNVIPADDWKHSAERRADKEDGRGENE